MEITVRRLYADKRTRDEFSQFAEIERAGRYKYNKFELLQDMMRYHEAQACFVGEKMTGYFLMNPNFPYFGNSLHIFDWTQDWEYNTEEFIEQMLLAVLRCYEVSEAGKYVSMDIDRKHDPNKRIFLRMGFRESILPSRCGASHVVLFAPIDELLEKSRFRP